MYMHTVLQSGFLILGLELIRGHCLSFAVVGEVLSSGVRPWTVDSTPPLSCVTEYVAQNPKDSRHL